MSLELRRAIKEFEDTKLPEWSQKLSKVVGQPVPIEVDWTHFGSPQDIPDIESRCLKPLLDHLPEVCVDDLGKDLVQSLVKKVRISYTDDMSKEGLFAHDGVFDIVGFSQMGRFTTHYVEFFLKFGESETSTLAYRRAKHHLEENQWPQAMAQIEKLVGQPISIEIDWPTMSTTYWVENLDKKVFQPLLEDLTQICRDDFGKEALRSIVKKISISCTERATNMGMKLDNGVWYVIGNDTAGFFNAGAFSEFFEKNAA